jgi:hypothetical protein
MASWHHIGEQVSPNPVHAWLDLEGLGWVRLHTPSDGSLEVREELPTTDVDMGDLGRIVVSPVTTGPLAQFPGSSIVSVAPLWQEPPGHSVGWALVSETSTVAIANLGDDLVWDAWPDAQWDVAGVVLQAPTTRQA